MKFKNPFYTDQVVQWVENRRAQIETYLTNKGQQIITFDEIRADFPDLTDPITGGALTDGTISEILKAIGAEIA